jgi:hypothetical protein
MELGQSISIADQMSGLFATEPSRLLDNRPLKASGQYSCNKALKRRRPASCKKWSRFIPPGLRMRSMSSAGPPKLNRTYFMMSYWSEAMAHKYPI